jgi:hypothetical protein
MGNLVVTGSIAGTKLMASNIISATAQIGDLTVDHLKIKNGAVSTAASAATSGYTASVSMYLRDGAKVMVIATIEGSAGGVVTWDSPGQLMRIRQSSTLLNSTPMNHYRDIGPTGLAQWFMLATTLQARFTAPSEGTYNFNVVADHGFNFGASILVLEVSR